MDESIFNAPSVPIANEGFIAGMVGGQLTNGKSLIGCSFAGDPNKVAGAAWQGHQISLGRPLERGGFSPLFRADMNNYAAISSFGKASDGLYRRRKECHGCTYDLMLDDVGNGMSGKIDPGRILLPPSAAVITSPENAQVHYFLRGEHMTDRSVIEAVLEGLVPALGLERDSGFRGVTRVFRLPVGVNGKPKYMKDGRPFPCRLVLWEPDRRYTLSEIVRTYDVKPVQPRGRTAIDATPEQIAVADEYYAALLGALDYLGLLKGRRESSSGWLDITCPWTDEHTDLADTGAALARPSAANNFRGGFRCHHGHCEGRGINQLAMFVETALMRSAAPQKRAQP